MVERQKQVAEKELLVERRQVLEERGRRRRWELRLRPVGQMLEQLAVVAVAGQVREARPGVQVEVRQYFKAGS